MFWPSPAGNFLKEQRHSPPSQRTHTRFAVKLFRCSFKWKSSIIDEDRSKTLIISMGLQFILYVFILAGISMGNVHFLFFGIADDACNCLHLLLERNLLVNMSTN